MRRWSIIIVVAFCGCLTPEIASRSMMERLRAVGGPQGPDVVVFDVAEIEQPPSESFIDRDLWTALDESAVGLERKAALEDNGFRVGTVGGLPPGRLQALLSSDASCPDPHRITMRSGNAKVLNIGPVQSEMMFETKTAGAAAKTTTLSSAQGGFAVTPRRTNDGRVALAFVPQVQYGGRQIFIQPAEGEGWSLGGAKPTEKFTNLAFELTVAPSEYIVIGTRYDRMRTLGHATFVGTSGEKPVQRLLVIRARPQGDAPIEGWSIAGRQPSSAPLALQATKTSRGYRD